jgi:hypothetical protein
MPKFEYNSERETLVIPEYGRHIQKMIQQCKLEKDLNRRQAMADQIVKLMIQMVPQGRNVEDYQDRLWKHFFRIAEYDIDVVDHKGEKPVHINEVKTTSDLEYTQSYLKYRHYGKNIMLMIAKAMTMEDSPIRNGFIQVIGSYMKLAYRNWNSDHFVNDENIREDLKMMSEGQLIIPEGMSLDVLGSVVKHKRRKPQPNGRRKKRRN